MHVEWMNKQKGNVSGKKKESVHFPSGVLLFIFLFLLLKSLENTSSSGQSV